ncbi:MAG TPA: NAD(P)H-dependent oxidoreductase [Ignavibacteria bacterium]
MNIFIVYAHQEPQSFNASLKNLAIEVFTQAGHNVTVSDLYAMNFNPVSGRHNFTTVQNPDFYKQQLEEIYAFDNNGFAADINAEMEKIVWCDLLIFQFPIWWFSIPSILKGWIDRVLAMGFAYGGGRIFDKGVFKGKKAMLSLTTGGPEKMFTKEGLFGDIDMLLYPIHHGVFEFCGFEVIPPFIVYGVAHLDEENRKKYLDVYKDKLLNIK